MPVIDTAYDGNTVTVFLRKTKIPGNKLDWDEKLKKGKTTRFGEQGAAARTLGSYEASDASLDLETAVWASIVLPLLPKNGYGNFPFPVFGRMAYPDVSGPYEVELQKCTIIGVKEGVEGGSEKPNMVTLSLQVMQIRRKDAVGVWHTLNRILREPASKASDLRL